MSAPSTPSVSVPRLLVHAAAPGGLPAVTGFPVLAQQAAQYLAGAVAITPDGDRFPVQVHALTPVTPQGQQWLEASFLPTVSGAVSLEPAAPLSGAALGTSTDQGATLRTGDLVVHLHAGGAQPVTIELAGQPLGALWPQVVTGKGIVHHEADQPQRKVRLVRNGPLRVQAEIHGSLVYQGDHPSLSYRLTVELWAQQRTLRVDWMLSHLTPGVSHYDIERASLLGQWEVGAQPTRRFLQPSHGRYYKPHEVLNPAPVALITDETSSRVHVADPAMLLDEEEYAHYLAAPTIATGDYLVLQGTHAAVAAQLVDMSATRPNQLRSEGSWLSYDLIPAGHRTTWPQGRRKEQTLLLALAGAEGLPDHRALPGLLSIPRTSGRAQPCPQYLTAMEAFDLTRVLPHQPGVNIRFSRLLDRLCQLNTPAEKWNLGDTVDTHYSLGYPGIPNRFEWLPNAPELPRSYTNFGISGTLLPPSMLPFIEPVWTNNEYDIVHALATQVMRTGSGDYATMLRWFARHTVEIDFLAYNDDRWHHRAQPAHSAHHHTTGAYPSHFWTQGLLQYFVLTGDRDAEEVCLALGDKIIENNHEPTMRQWGFDREMGWGLLALVCLLELGYDQYRGECDEIVNYLVSFDRAGFTGAVNLSAGRAGRSLERQMIDNGFGYFSMVEAIDRYQRCTGREDVAQWLDTLLNQLRQEVWNAIREGDVPVFSFMSPVMLAIGFERTGNEDFLRAGLVVLDHFMDMLAMPCNTQWEAEARWGQTKPNAKMYRGLSRFLGAANQRGLLKRFEFPSLRGE